MTFTHTGSEDESMFDVLTKKIPPFASLIGNRSNAIKSKCEQMRCHCMNEKENASDKVRTRERGI